MMDDDIILYEDLAPLMQHIRQHPERLSLACAIDPRRVDRYYTSKNRTNNGHTRRGIATLESLDFTSLGANLV